MNSVIDRSIEEVVIDLAQKARAASLELSQLGSEKKNDILKV